MYCSPPVNSNMITTSDTGEKRKKEIYHGTEVLVLNCTYIIISLLFIKILTTLKLEQYLKICHKCHFKFAH